MKGFLDDAGAQETIGRLKKLLKGRADSYEIYFQFQKGLGVEAKDGAVDALKARSSRGVGLRTISGKRLGFAFTSVLSEGALSELVESAISGSREASEDEYLKLPLPQQGLSEEDLGLFDGSFGTRPEEELIKAAVDIEEAALSFDQRVKRVRKASFSESLGAGRLVNSNGVDIVHAATYYSGSVTAVAEGDGEAQMGWEMGTGHKGADVDSRSIGSKAAENAVKRLGARTIKTTRCGAIIENTVACELLEALAGSFLGDGVLKGKSMLIGKKGKKVASGALNIWDDGVLRGGWATSAFDAEGTASRKTALVLEGVCRGFLYDAYWAGRAGAASTGNAVRGGYKSTPGIGITNLYIEKGGRGFETLLKELGSGLFITELLGVHTINAVSGDFSLGAAGFRVENGEVAYPVRGMAVSGNLLGLFSSVAECASDLRFIGSIGAPSLLVEEIEASGT
ncbi:MAG: TldD/PmbA family protein [Deltaproteobacteria bacterium]|nr:TldD/PmbA family protein [Deltaproteobacteria bacterium]MCL4872936.1 TldD/PmbA family protein [bacterium]